MADRDLIGISEVADATGLQSSALRYYEKVGLIRPAGRAGGRRRYDRSVLQRLAAISLFQEAGFTIAEMRQLLSDSARSTWRSMTERKRAELDEHLVHIAAARELLVAAIQCKCSGSTRASWSPDGAAAIAEWFRISLRRHAVEPGSAERGTANADLQQDLAHVLLCS